MRTTPHRFALAAAALLALVLGGCVSLPEEGAVVSTQADAEAETDRPMAIDPAPPRPGASAAEIASGFLDAMEASPIRVDVARQFLDEASQRSWDPQRRTIVHEGLSAPRRNGSMIAVTLTDPELLDRRGAWRGPARKETLQFQMVQEGGEYRINDPVNALVVSSTWFEARYEQVSLYFFDRTARVLVPEPVFVPRGEQMATSLVDGLLDGPPEQLGASGRTFVPSRLSVGLSVPVSRAGVADISLVGESDLPDDDTVDRMLAQFAWTLRQEPSIESFTITIGEQEVRLPGGVTEFPVNGGGRYDPSGYQSSSLLYGLREGLLVSGTYQDLTPVSGPFGQEGYGVRSMAVSLDGATVAAVSGDGTAVLRGSVPEEVDGPGTDSVQQILSGAVDLLPPAYDLSERLWLVERRASGAKVSYLVEDRPVEIEIPEVSGRQVRHFLVSRDATRFVAVVRSRGVDQVRVGRLRVSENGRVLRSTDTRPLTFDGSERLRVRDLVWTSPTSIALLSPIATDDLFAVTVVDVDGAPTGLGVRNSTANGAVRALVGSPAPDAATYARTDEGLLTLGEPGFSALDGRVTALQYAG